MPTPPPPRRFLPGPPPRKGRDPPRPDELEDGESDPIEPGVLALSTGRLLRRSRSKASKGLERLVVLSRISSALGIHSSTGPAEDAEAWLVEAVVREFTVALAALVSPSLPRLPMFDPSADCLFSSVTFDTRVRPELSERYVVGFTTM